MKNVRLLLCLAVLLGIGSACALPADPSERGPYGIGELRQHLIDPAGVREVDVLVLYPQVEAQSDTAPRFPLILFNHGFMLWGELYRSYGERLATHGFVVALPTYPMSFTSLNHTELAADARFVIDFCLALGRTKGSPLDGLLDESAVGAAGHSFGGKLALLEASTDPRVGAIAALDPVDGAGPVPDDPVLFPSVTPERMDQIHAPTLFLGADLGGVPYFFIPCAPPDENYRQFYEAANSPALEVTQLGAGHGQYVDPGAEAMLAACAPGTTDGAWVRSSSAAYMTAFFLGHLSGDAAALAWLDARLAEDQAQGRILLRQK